MIGLDPLSILLGVAIGVLAMIIVRALDLRGPSAIDRAFNGDPPPATLHQIRRARRAARLQLARTRGGR